MTLRLDTAAEFISELAGNAAKEASIEAGLASIATTWSALELDMAEYKVGAGLYGRALSSWLLALWLLGSVAVSWQGWGPTQGAAHCMSGL